MARIYALTDRIKLEVDERGLVKCGTCEGKGVVANKKGATVTFPRCPVCQGFKSLPGNEVVSTVVYTLAPMSWAQKQEILSQSRMLSGSVVSDDARRAYLAIKYSVKGVEGLSWFDGETDVTFVPAFDVAGNLEEDSIEKLLNCQLTSAMTEYTKSLIGGVSQFVIDPGTGLQMAGVRVVLPGDKKKA